MGIFKEIENGLVRSLTLVDATGAGLHGQLLGGSHDVGGGCGEGMSRSKLLGWWERWCRQRANQSVKTKSKRRLVKEGLGNHS